MVAKYQVQKKYEPTTTVSAIPTPSTWGIGGREQYRRNTGGLFGGDAGKVGKEILSILTATMGGGTRRHGDDILSRTILSQVGTKTATKTATVIPVEARGGPQVLPQMARVLGFPAEKETTPQTRRLPPTPKKPPKLPWEDLIKNLPKEFIEKDRRYIQDPNMAIDLGNILSNVQKAADIYSGIKQASYVPTYSTSGLGSALTPDWIEKLLAGTQPTAEEAALAALLGKKKKRRRRRRLATVSDIRDLAALKSILGGGQDLKTWIATHPS